MRRFITTTLLITAILVGGWLLYHKDQINDASDVMRLAQAQLSQWQDSTNRLIPWEQQKDVVRIATLDTHGLDSARMEDARAIRTVAEIVRQFDVIGLQGIATDDPHFLKRFLKIVNETGRQYQAAFQFQSGRPTQMAFLFDSTSISLESQRVYLVHDPDQLFAQTPLVGWFRCLQADPEEAFTFSLVNVQLDPYNVGFELSSLDELFRAVRNDGRSEDDVLLLGNLWSGDAQLQPLADRFGLDWVVQNRTTDTMGTRQLENMIFDALATGEFTGEGGVFDFVKHFNLTLQEAQAACPHLPVWAEFSTLEDREVPRMVEQETDPLRFARFSNWIASLDWLR